MLFWRRTFALSATTSPRLRLHFDRTGALTRRLDAYETPVLMLQPNQSCSAYTHAETEYTSKLDIIDPAGHNNVPAFQLLNSSGRLLVDESELSEECRALMSDRHTFAGVDDVKLVSMYKMMTTLNTMDKIMYESQRQGRISFYMTNYGEEASHIGSAAALKSVDLIYGQYREAGIFLYRGFTLDEFMNQLYGNHLDLGKGKQMPVHYGSRDLNFSTISSPLSTQMPQAAGSAYAFRLLGENDRVTACYFGEGAASEGDAHAAFNFAATLAAPVLFICRNNGYAISTPVVDQYASDGIVTRGAGYGIPAIRVDGNDILAVFEAVRQARNLAVTQSRPVLIEAMTYRIGHHSTSDDSSAYRSRHEVDKWDNTLLNPIKRLATFLIDQSLWSVEADEALTKLVKRDVMKAFNAAEARPKPEWEELFNDVYDEQPVHIVEQREEMKRHVAANEDAYPLRDHRA